MQVLELRDQHRKEWDEFVYSCAQASFFHLAGWREVMQETFGLRCHYLLAKEGGHVRGILPLVQIRGLFTENYITSVPGALCTEDEDAALALAGRAQDLVRVSDARYLILRDSPRKWDLPNLVTSENHCTLIVELPDDPEQILKSVNRRVRQLIRKATKVGLVVDQSTSLQEFYPVYLRAMRERGTPTHGHAFFAKSGERLPGHTLMTVRHDDQIVGGGFVASFKNTLYQTWAGLLPRYYGLGSSYLLYWETLRYACGRGLEWVDLGRSLRGSGSYQFKKQWGATPRPLHQQCYLNGARRAPPVGGKWQTETSYRLFVRLWRLLPLWATEILGPEVRRRMPFG